MLHMYDHLTVIINNKNITITRVEEIQEYNKNTEDPILISNGNDDSFTTESNCKIVGCI